MKNYVTEIIKDIIMGILIVTCIVIILSIVLYDKIALTRVIPEAEEYFLTEEMEQEVEESNLEETQEVIINYYIDAADLKKYEKTNEYIKGKNNPFEMSSEYTGNTNINNTTTGSDTNKGFYNDEGIK